MQFDQSAQWKKKTVIPFCNIVIVQLCFLLHLVYKTQISLELRVFQRTYLKICFLLFENKIISSNNKNYYCHYCYYQLVLHTL